MKKRSVTDNVYDLALARMRTAFDRFDHIAVGFSGGKDSTIVYQLAVEVARERGRLPLDMFFWDEEAIHPETIEYVERVAQNPDVALRWLCAPIVHRNACSKRHPYWSPWAPEDEAKWCRPFPPRGIHELAGYGGLHDPSVRKTIPDMIPYLFPDASKTVGAMMGIRAAESLRRYRSVTTRVYDNWISLNHDAPHVSMLKPIYDWTTTDVWTAPQRFGWDYNRAYDVLQAAGVSRHEQRVCPPYGEEPLQGLWHYAVCWPQLWEKMIARVPGATTAGRYCRSTLYAHGGVSKPDDLTWQQAVVKEIKKFPPDVASQIAARIKREITQHNNDTGSAPIPDDSMYGLSWRMIYRIAVRGDLKQRRNVRHAGDAEPKKETRFEGT